jgi:hypothetical protein
MNTRRRRSPEEFAEQEERVRKLREKKK